MLQQRSKHPREIVITPKASTSNVAVQVAPTIVAALSSHSFRYLDSQLLSAWERPQVKDVFSTPHIVAQVAPTMAAALSSNGQCPPDNDLLRAVERIMLSPELEQIENLISLKIEGGLTIQIIVITRSSKAR